MAEVTSAPAGAVATWVAHGPGHADLRLSIAAGTLLAAPMLARVLFLVAYVVLFTLYGMLAATAGLLYALVRGKDPAEYLARALAQFTSVYISYTMLVPWIPQASQPPPRQPAGASPPDQLRTATFVPHPVSVVRNLAARQGPALPGESHGGGRHGRHVAA